MRDADANANVWCSSTDTHNLMIVRVFLSATPKEMLRCLSLSSLSPSNWWVCVGGFPRIYNIIYWSWYYSNVSFDRHHLCYGCSSNSSPNHAHAHTHTFAHKTIACRLTSLGQCVWKQNIILEESMNKSSSRKKRTETNSNGRATTATHTIRIHI